MQPDEHSLRADLESARFPVRTRVDGYIVTSSGHTSSSMSVPKMVGALLFA